MGVEDPGMLKVTCDECGEEEEFDTTSYAGDPISFGIDSETLKANKWSQGDGDSTLCEKCTKVANGEAEECEEDHGDLDEGIRCPICGILKDDVDDE